MGQTGSAHVEEVLRGIGISEKGARVYHAALKLGEATVQELAKQAGLKRTTLYYVLEELFAAAAIIEVRRGKKQYFAAAEPRSLLREARTNIDVFADAILEIEELKLSRYKKPGVRFLHGPSGFKQVWDRVFESKEKEYSIMTTAEHFLDFVPEKYITSEIIKGKRIRGIKSRQLITDSAYARKVVSKDLSEGRSSKFLSSRYPLPYTEIIGDMFVALISPRPDNLILVIESDAFAKTRRSYFELLWNALP